MIPRARTLAAVGTAAILAAPVLIATPAEAAARVTVRNDRGTVAADTTYATRLTVSGTGFQVVKGGRGGLYVMFGWVDDPRSGSWRPSRGGLTGQDYRYVPDSETSGNKGYVAFVAFPGSSTSGEAQATFTGSGRFTVNLTVPGPVFQSVDRSGELRTVDCRRVTCGVITIGAHGLQSAANETFTPVRFGTVYDRAPTGTGAGDSEGPATPSGDGTEESGTQQARETRRRSGPAAVTTDRLTARTGHALAFTGKGFRPGEQVLAILDDGVAALGPMIAGTSGEIAGLLQLPADLPPGTHELRVVGAGSGAKAVERFPIVAAEVSNGSQDPAGSAAATTAALAPEDDSPSMLAPRAFAGGAFLAFAASLAFLVLRLRATRRDPAGSPA